LEYRFGISDKKGKKIRTIKERDFVRVLMAEVENMIGEV